MIDAELWRTQCQSAIGVGAVDDIVAVVGFHSGDTQGEIAGLEWLTRLRRVVEKCRCMMSLRGNAARCTDVSGGYVKQLNTPVEVGKSANTMSVGHPHE